MQPRSAWAQRGVRAVLHGGGPGHGEWYGGDDWVDGRRAQRRWRSGSAQPGRRLGAGVARAQRVAGPMARRVGGRVWSGPAEI